MFWQPHHSGTTYEHHVNTTWTPREHYVNTTWTLCEHHVNTMWTLCEHHMNTMWTPCGRVGDYVNLGTSFCQQPQTEIDINQTWQWTWYRNLFYHPLAAITMVTIFSPFPHYWSSWAATEMVHWELRHVNVTSNLRSIKSTFFCNKGVKYEQKKNLKSNTLGSHHPCPC